jgi:hypothetical protein
MRWPWELQSKGLQFSQHPIAKVVVWQNEPNGCFSTSSRSKIFDAEVLHSKCCDFQEGNWATENLIEFGEI